MQPFYAATWQRALERIGGTVLGGIVGAVLAYYAATPLWQAGMILALSIVGFAARQISYGFFITCLKPPLVVLLVEVLEPGHSSWEIVGERRPSRCSAVRVIAVASCLVLWPIWEPDQVRRELRRTLADHAAFARAVLKAAPGEDRDTATGATARAAGLALNDLEAALSRALQQPRAGHHPEVEAAMVADATLRRISARLSVLRHLPDASDRRTRRGGTGSWGTLAALGDGETSLPPRPETPRGPSFARLAAQVDLLTGTLRPAKAGPPPSPRLERGRIGC